MPAWLEQSWEWLSGAGVVGMLLGWYARRKIRQMDEQHRQINALVTAMEGKANREQVEALGDRIAAKIDEHGKESREGLQRLEGKMDKRLGSLESKVDDAIAAQNQINLDVARRLGRD